MQKFTIAIHGGAGTILKANMTPEKEVLYRKALQEAVNAGYTILEQNGSAMDAVKAAVISLEDCPLFNAGKGSVFNKEGTQEMDASIMDGKDLSAGAVAGVRNVRNPITLAYEVMRNSDHVFLSGKGAQEFAVKQGLKIESDEYFFSQFRYDQWQAIRESEKTALDHSLQAANEAKDQQETGEKKFGTVGAVACDSNGNVAAATSTGGMTNKKYGRIGDSPVIGAGTYANNKTCAVSSTGHGEMFIRAVVAYDIHALMDYKGLSLESAAEEVVNKKLMAIGGDGGVIGVDKNGNAALVMNCPGMYRAVRSSDGTNEVAIYNEKFVE